MYPGWHLLGSRDWVSDDRPVFSEPPLGEYSGATKWYRGDPPAVLPLPVYTGSMDCIQFGERAGLAIQINKSARCTDMLPRACYLDSEILRQKTNIDNCTWAFECMRIIALAYEDLPAAALHIAAFFEDLVAVYTEPVLSQLFPAYVVAVKDDLCMVWITGTTNLWQGALQAFYFGSGPVSQGEYSTSQIYEAAALLVMHRLAATAGVPDCTRFILSGHSYGAAVAFVVAAKLKIVDPTREVELLTFGMPNPGGVSLIERMHDCPQKHYAGFDDPVPFIPPTGYDLFANYGAFGALLSLQWSRYARPEQIIIITEDGKLDLRSSSGIDNSQITTLALLLAAASDIEPFTGHDTGTYLERLAAACPCVPKPANRYKITYTGVTIHTPTIHVFPFIELFVERFEDPFFGSYWYFNDFVTTASIIERIEENGPYNFYAYFRDPLAGYGEDCYIPLPADWFTGKTFNDVTTTTITLGYLVQITEIKIEPAELV